MFLKPTVKTRVERKVEIWFSENAQAAPRLRLALAVAGLFKPHLADLDEPRLVHGVGSRMLQPFPEEHHLGRRQETAVSVLGHYGAALGREFGSEPFIGVQVENPWVPKCDVAHRPVALLGETHKRVSHDVRARGSRNVKSCVGAARVENDDVVAPRDRFDTGGQAALLIASQDQDGETHHCADPGRKRRIVAGFPPTMARAGTSFTTTARAPTMAPSPTVTPGPINASVQIQVPSQTVTGGLRSGNSASRKSCVPAQRCARYDTVTPAPMRIGPRLYK